MARGLVSLLLLLAGMAMTLVAIPSAWIDRDLLDNDRYTDAVAPLIHEPVVQEQVARALTTPISERLDLSPVLERLLQDATEKVVATEAFVPVWTDAVRLSHQSAVEGLRDEGKGVNFVKDGVVVDRKALVEALRPRLAEAGLPFADQIPAGEGTIVLARGPDVDRAVTIARVADRWAPEMAVAAVVLLLLSVLVARRRGLALTVAGLGVLAVAGLWWWGIGSDRNGLLSAAGDEPVTTTHLLWDALSASLRDLVRGVAVAGGVTTGLGLVVALLGAVGGRRRPA
ncbi:hypothetical protein [Nocardioides jishulii]|uniref:Integral membrane protein n=1 Tax=Nocardioides jishulii TaxID=2575440 RepID=A0A4U2YII9_9ACTN|nr:hypothetical protein [Nocardioides jishulii]QCX26745.1 hypothetical protein FCL41_03690 [Nocardioides jishulii]TKI60285.1 hypothetical protein FC770_15860 [Nocardioides jishulii]